MIQKGIIAQVIDKYTYKIRIPKYDKIEAATASTKTDDLSNGIVCAMPGVDVSYVLGDIVLVSFENDELSKPIILGLLYREQKTDSDISLTNVDDSLSDIQNNLQKINSSGLYTHIRYSNDNGLTFTSLFSDSNHETIINGEVVCQPLYDDTEVNGIKIDKDTRVISWSIIDSNNADVTDEIGIEITVFDSNGNIIKKERNTDHQRSFTINNSSKITGDLYFTYKLYVTKEYLDTLSVMITTDKAPFGVPTGEYVGVYVSNNSRASINTSDYSWFQSSAGGDIDTEINNKIARLSAEFDIKLDNLKDEVDENFVTIYYKSVEWTQAEVDVYCQTGYEGAWSRDMSSGYTGEVKTGNVLYITVHNTGTSSSSTDDSYGQLEIRALADAVAGESVQGVVLSYLVSAEVALDALARFKSSLLEPGDETLIYGGHITTGRIQDSSGKNFIQLSAENGTPAGQMEFKDQTSWALSNQGIQWDSGHGQLNVKGNIQANSLTIIGNDGQYYNGTDAINISGYELTLEVVDIDGSYCYVYPHLYLNGDEVTGIISASLPLDTTNKIYYTRSGSAPHYDYTVVSDPVEGSISSYYESTIDYSRFIWYRNNSSIGEVGDNTHEGRIRAAYTDTLRCTYSFAEGGTGGAQSAVTVEVDPSRYITRNSATDITVHPETYQNASSYLQLNNNGLNVFDRNGDSIAQYGSTARVGKNNSSRFLINSGSLQAYDNNNVKYFEVSNGDLSWGDNTAATTADLATKADTSAVQSVQTLAASKKRVFSSEPTTPYEVGDLWAGGSSGDLKICTTARASGNFVSTDWVLATKYTSDAAFTSFRDGTYANFVTSTSNALNGKITTYYQAGPTSPTASATGDLWIDTNDNNKLYRWNGSSWDLVRDSGIQTALSNAQHAQETADGKIVTYAQASAPTGLGLTDNGDLWIDTDDNNKLYRWSGVSWVAYSEVDKLQIGGRNLVRNTATPAVITVRSGTNRNTHLYSFSDAAIGDGRLIYLNDSGYTTIAPYIISFDWETDDTTGTFLLQTNDIPLRNLLGSSITVSSTNQKGHFEYLSVQYTSPTYTTIPATGLYLRTDNMTEGKTLTISNLKIELGNKVTDWTPAPEDSIINPNLLVNSRTLGGYYEPDGTLDVNYKVWQEDYCYYELIGSSSNWNAMFKFPFLQDISTLDGSWWTLSFEYKASAHNSVVLSVSGFSAAADRWLWDQGRTKYIVLPTYIANPSTEWKKGWITFKTTASELSSGSGSGDVNSWGLYLYSRADSTIQIRKPKLEKSSGYSAWCENEFNQIEGSGENILRGASNPKLGSATIGYGWDNSVFYTSGTGSNTWDYSITNSPVPEVTKGVLCTNTSTTVTTMIGFAQNNVPLRKEPVVFSIWAKGTAGDFVRLQPIWKNAASDAPEIGNARYKIIDNNWHKYYMPKMPLYEHIPPKTTVSGTDYDFNAGYVYFSSATANHTFTAVAPKLEYGTIPTDYSVNTTDASKTATSYITIIDKGGIKVHDANDKTNYIALDSNGMSVYQNSVEAATFGTRTRIGKAADGFTKILIDSSGKVDDFEEIFKIVSRTDVPAQTVYMDSTVEGIQTVSKVFEDEYSIPTPINITTTDTNYNRTFEIPAIGSVTTGDEFSLRFVVGGTCNTGGYEIRIEPNDFALGFDYTFEKASSGNAVTQTQTKTFVDTREDPTQTLTVRVDLTYTPPTTVRIDLYCRRSKATLDNTGYYRLYTAQLAWMSYERLNDSIPMTDFNGNIMFNSQKIGRVFVGLDRDTEGPTPAADGIDAKLVNDLLELGWTECIVGVAFKQAEFSDWHANVGDTLYLDYTVCPPYSSVTFASSDEAKITVEDGVCTCVSRGSAYITATLKFNGKTYTDTCKVTMNSAS